MLTCVLGRYVASAVSLVLKPFGGRRQRRWTAARRKRVPLQWRNHFWQSLEEGAGKRCLECAEDFVPLGNAEEASQAGESC